MSDRADRMAAALADRLLAATGGLEEARTGERAILASTLGHAGIALCLLVPALTFFTGPAIALPVSLALVGAAFLIASLALIGWSRSMMAAEALAEQQAAAIASHTAGPQQTTGDPDWMDGYRLCPGLVLSLDQQGVVLAAGGRDHDRISAGLGELTGRAFVDHVHVLDRISLLQALDALRQGEDQARAELRLEPLAELDQREGQFTPVRLDLSAARDGEGAITRILCQVTEAAEEVALRLQAAEKTREAESANESKSRFLAAVSHELRTPLNAILGFSDILLGEYFGKLADDRQKEYVTLIRQSGGHLLSVVNTMLDMSKIEAGRYELMMEPFLASEPVRICEEMLGLQAREKGLTLTSRVARDLGEVTADRRAVQQVLINLVGNAIKFTNAGGVVSIDASRRDGQFVLVVSDTGIGIAADKLHLIGQPFQQIQNDYTRSYEGTGLGLSLVKGLVGLHGGQFHIASKAGEGTVITILLPEDGSGTPGAHDGDASDRPVEFPPRLGAARKDADRQHEVVNHGAEKARTAG